MISGLYARLIGVGLIVASALGAWWYVSNLRSENARLTSEVAVLGSKLKDQNDAVDVFKKDADARLATAKSDLDKAHAETKAAKQRSTVIYKTQPSIPGDSCRSALDLVNGGTK